MNSLKVKDYMTLQAVTFTVDMSLSAALNKVMKSVVMGGPVINEKEEVIGFLSEQDLLDKLVKASYHCQDSYTVGECMHSDVLSVSSDMSIIETGRHDESWQTEDVSGGRQQKIGRGDHSSRRVKSDWSKSR